MSERSDVVKPILQALAKCPGVLAIRVNAGGYRGRMRGAPAGTADVVGLGAFNSMHADLPWGPPCGRFFAIEAKLPRARTAPRTAKAQAAFAAKVRQLGGIYIVATTVAEALEGLGLTP